MHHLSRRFSGNAYLYVVLASLAWLISFNLAATFSIGFYFYQEHATLIKLFSLLAIAVPPIAASMRHSLRPALRAHPFTLAQLGFTIAIALCVYLALDALDTLCSQLMKNLLAPDLSEFGHFFSVRTMPSWVHILTISLVGAVMDGGLYCGVVLSGLHPMRPLKACLTVGLLYALVQFDLAAFIPGAVLGFVLAYLTLRTGSIFPGMIAGFIYLLLDDFSVSGRLYHSVLGPAGLSENIAVVLLSVIFTLLGGLLLAKMPDRRYEQGGAKRVLGKLRRIMPGLFSLSAFDKPTPEDTLPDETAAEAAPDEMAEPSPEENEPETPNPRDNNPMIAGIFISAIITVVLFGLSVFSALGYFQG